MTLALLIIALALLLYSRSQGNRASRIRLMAENHLVQMYVIAHSLRQRHLEGKEDAAQLNRNADRLIQEQFALRPHLRADGDHEGLLALGARLCYELNDLLLISSADEVKKRLRQEHERVKRSEIEQEVHGLALRRLRLIK